MTAATECPLSDDELVMRDAVIGGMSDRECMLLFDSLGLWHNRVAKWCVISPEWGAELFAWLVHMRSELNVHTTPYSVDAFTGRVMVRFDRNGLPMMVNHPEKGWASYAWVVKWLDLFSIQGWQIGPLEQDRYSTFVWLTREGS